MPAAQYKLSDNLRNKLGHPPGSFNGLFTKFTAAADLEYGIGVALTLPAGTVAAAASKVIGVTVSGGLDKNFSDTTEFPVGVKMGDPVAVRATGFAIWQIDVVSANKPAVTDTIYVNAEGKLSKTATSNKAFNGRVLSVETESPAGTAVVYLGGALSA